jgi:hypothetical protein
MRYTRDPSLRLKNGSGQDDALREPGIQEHFIDED